MITKQYLEGKLKELMNTKTQTLLHAQVIDGAIQFCELMLKEIQDQDTDTTPISSTETVTISKVR